MQGLQKTSYELPAAVVFAMFHKHMILFLRVVSVICKDVTSP